MSVSIMMQLGSYQFGLSTAAYQEFSRTSEYRWPTQEVYGGMPRLQYTGQGSETVELPGVIYPEFRGGIGQIEKMRTEAGKGQPLLMVSGTGKLWGKWAIERITEKQTLFGLDGLPRKQEFTLSIRKFQEK